MSARFLLQNSNLIPFLIEAFHEYKETHPTGTVSLSTSLTGYSDSLSTACKIPATTYLNHYVENFEQYIKEYIAFLLCQRFPVTLFFTFELIKSHAHRVSSQATPLVQALYALIIKLISSKDLKMNWGLTEDSRQH